MEKRVFKACDTVPLIFYFYQPLSTFCVLSFSSDILLFSLISAILLFFFPVRSSFRQLLSSSTLYAYNFGNDRLLLCCMLIILTMNIFFFPVHSSLRQVSSSSPLYAHHFDIEHLLLSCMFIIAAMNIFYAARSSFWK